MATVSKGTCIQDVKAFLRRATPKEIKKMLGEINPEAILLDGFDEALIGMVSLWPSSAGGAFFRSPLSQEQLQYLRQLVDHQILSQEQFEDLVNVQRFSIEKMQGGGGGQQAGVTVAVYDAPTMVEILVKKFKVPGDQALKHFEEKIDQVFMGPHTPLFLTRPDSRKRLEGWDPVSF